MESSTSTTPTKSNIRSEIEYSPKRTIHPEDCDVELSVYEIHALNTDFIVALGKPKYNYTKYGVIFVPIYFVPSNSDEEKVQIGVYEYEQERAIALLDRDGDLDVESLVPIFYPFAASIVGHVPSNVTEYLSKNPFQSVEQEEEEEKAPEEPEEEEEDSDEEDDDVLNLSKSKKSRFTETTASASSAKTPVVTKDTIFTVHTTHVHPPMLPMETKEDAQEIKKQFQSSTSASATAPANQLWIQEFMHNPYYMIHEVEDNGDCFFATIREAFKQIGYETTVAKLRAILAQEVTYDIFKENRQLFMDLEGSKREYDQELDKIKQGNARLKHRFQQLSSSSASAKERDDIREELQKISVKYKEVTELRNNTDKIIKETMGDLSDITTFDQYKAFVQSTRYWADSWAISTLEKALNVKMIIFSELDYNEEAVHSVLNCGEINRELEKAGKFAPKHYIMVTYSGLHYNLISYKNKKILTFPEIPYDVKTMIVNKCIEKNAGIYYLIDDFRTFKMQLGIQPNVGAPDLESEGEEDEEGRVSSVDLYDAGIVFRFFIKSEKTPLPGKGAGESIPKDKMVEYKDLKTVVDWRRKLDDAWTDEEHPLVLDGARYASVEHYYQSSKFRYDHAPKSNLDFAALFSLDSDSKISKDVGLAMAAGSKTGKSKSKEKKDTLLRPKEVTMDPNFYEGRHERERRRALQYKFEQIPEMNRLLKMTKRAKLVKYVAKQPPEVDVALMEVRKWLMNN